jgi:uncharacterized protein YecT (DUF1311 family)
LKLLLSLLFLAGMATCLAQHSAQPDTRFATAMTQASINACASEEAERADTELSRLYSELLSLVGGRREIVVKIKTAQNAWLSWRDAYMDAMYPAKDKQFEYGSVYPTNANLLRAKLTQQQIGAVMDLIKQFRASAQ